MAKSKQHKRNIKHQFGNPPHHLKKEPYMPRITFCIPSKNNLRYVKVAIESIRRMHSEKTITYTFWLIPMKTNVMSG